MRKIIVTILVSVILIGTGMFMGLEYSSYKSNKLCEETTTKLSKEDIMNMDIHDLVSSYTKIEYGDKYVAGSVGYNEGNLDYVDYTVFDASSGEAKWYKTTNINYMRNEVYYFQ